MAAERIRELEEQLERMGAALRDSESRYNQLVRETKGLICTHDLNGVLLFVNPAATQMLGYSQDEMVGRELREFMPAEALTLYPAFLEKMRLHGADSGRLLMIAKDGRLVTFQYHNVVIREANGEPYVLGHAYDISEVIALQRRLEELTVTDDLTGLLNRRGFLARAEERVKLARRHRESLVLIFADVDGLKKINDEHGHSAGSQVIMDASQVLSDSFRQTDILSRWGGDEFVILLGRASEAGMEIVFRRINQKIATLDRNNCQPYTLSLSFGIAPVNPESNAPLDEIISAADKKMYEQKRGKKGL